MTFSKLSSFIENMQSGNNYIHINRIQSKIYNMRRWITQSPMPGICINLFVCIECYLLVQKAQPIYKMSR